MRKLPVDLLPEIEQMIDVHERIVAVAVAVNSQECAGEADDEIARPPTISCNLGPPRLVDEVEPDRLRDHVKRLVEPHLLEAATRRLHRDHVGRHVRKAEKADLLVSEPRIVDIHDDLPLKMRNLVHPVHNA